MYNVTIDRIRIFVWERWMLSWILPRVLTNLSLAFFQSVQACISGHTIKFTAKLKGCHLCSFHFLIFPNCAAFAGV